MEKTEKKSFDLASDVTKQLIALSTGIISLCAAFTDKIFSKADAQEHSTLIGWALGFFVLSILFGLSTQMKMTGIMANWKERDDKKSAIYDGATRLFSTLQLFSFFIAVVLSLVFVCMSLSSSSFPDKVETSVERKISPDTLVICIEGNCSYSVKPIHSSKKKTSSCVKYMKVNTCTDTIVTKILLDSLSNKTMYQ